MLNEEGSHTPYLIRFDLKQFLSLKYGRSEVSRNKRTETYFERRSFSAMKKF